MKTSTPNNTGNHDLTQVKQFIEYLLENADQHWLGASHDFEHFMLMLNRLKTLSRPQINIQSEGRPVHRDWSNVLRLLKNGDSTRVAECLDNLADQLRWMQCPNYTPENTSRLFIDNYAYCELIGRDGLCWGQTMSMGLMLLGPDTYYPPHSHPSSECLYTICGRGTWHLAGGPTISLPPGAIISIPNGENHAFWSMDTPLLAVYICEGEIDAYPVLANRNVPR
ncbi:MAG: cupin domain-containing protein [Deltaproteobacteria bacterium]|nr:cupin domain-containing protein [Deltaproteobacteria bacterium]